MVTAFERKNNVKPLFTPKAVHESLGACERAHRTLRALVEKVSAELRQADCTTLTREDVLGAVEFAKNNMTPAHGASANMIAFGIQINMVDTVIIKIKIALIMIHKNNVIVIVNIVYGNLTHLIIMITQTIVMEVVFQTLAVILIMKEIVMLTIIVFM